MLLFNMTGVKLSYFWNRNLLNKREKERMIERERESEKNSRYVVMLLKLSIVYCIYSYEQCMSKPYITNNINGFSQPFFFIIVCCCSSHYSSSTVQWKKNCCQLM